MINHESHSFDLSQATDRFPIQIQLALLKEMYGDQFATCWKNLMVNRDFEYKGKMYRYGTGQPMGILSSWCVFSLTHHAFVQYCGYLNGVNHFRDYAVLGDDVVI